jgi:hypothetical protein
MSIPQVEATFDIPKPLLSVLSGVYLAYLAIPSAMNLIFIASGNSRFVFATETVPFTSLVVVSKGCQLKPPLLRYPVVDCPKFKK